MTSNSSREKVVSKSKEQDLCFHKNLTNWENIFNKKLSSIGSNKLEIDHVKDMLVAFLDSAEPPQKLEDTARLPLKIKQSEIAKTYLKDELFQEQLSALAENNISAFELLSKIIGDNSFEKGIEANYFYGFDLSETQSLFEQEM